MAHQGSQWAVLLPKGYFDNSESVFYFSMIHGCFWNEVVGARHGIHLAE